MTKVSREDIDAIRKSGLFDEKWYLEQYPDVKALGMDPVEHYLWVGRRLKRLPAPHFAGTLKEENLKATSESRARLFSAPAPSPRANNRVKRRLDAWDFDREREFYSLISRLSSSNTGYFNRIHCSIVMPVYNRPDQLCEAIDSVLAQDFDNWELIVIDDGSVADMRTAFSRYIRDARINFIQIAHAGVAAARNVALDAARGKYVFYLDSDNTWLPNFLRTMIVYMESGNLSAAYCGLRAFDDEGKTTGFRGDDFDWVQCLEQNYIDINCFGHVNRGPLSLRFDQSIRRLVDWDYILRVTKEVVTAFAPFCGVAYYEGRRGERITLVEGRGGELLQIERKIRAKHAEGRMGTALLELSSSVVLASLAAGGADVLSDDLSRELFRSEEASVDWAALTQTPRKSGMVSIVVLNFNGSDMTADCIRALRATTISKQYEVEIIIIDNGSEQKLSDSLEELSDNRIRLIRLESNLMFSVGNNIGLSNSCGEYVVFLNNDTLPQLGWLDPLIDSLRLDPTVGIVGPKLLYPDNTLQCGGLVFSNRSKVPYHIYRGADANALEVNRPRVFQALTGACMALRAKDAVRLRGFDPLFINGGEDLDLCFRMRHLLRKRSLYNPQAVVVHLESKTEGRGKYISRNREIFVRRWRGEVRADDSSYYTADGFRVASYTKPGREDDGETASYVPTLVPLARADVSAPRVTTNIGFSTIWHARGIAFHTKLLADALEGSEFKTHIFARWESQRFENGGAIYHPRVTNGGDDPSEESFESWLLQNNIAVMIFMEMHPRDWKRAKRAKSLGITIVCYENLDVLRFSDLARYEIFDYLLFNCFYAKDVLISVFPNKPMLVVPLGVAPPASVQHNMVPQRDAVNFVHVAGWGGVNGRKNTALLMRAFSRISAKHARLHVYTQSPLQEYGDEIVELAKKNPRIIVNQGTLGSIWSAYAEKDVLIWPSKREGIGLPILEALACGVPVIVADGYMMKQWLLPGEHGALCAGRPLPGQMMLPELEIREEELVSVIDEIIRRPEVIDHFREAIGRDRAQWLWSWQPEVLRTEIRQIAANRAYRPSDAMSYLPSEVLEFEFRRRQAFMINQAMRKF